jgi:hypothetical protein
MILGKPNKYYDIKIFDKLYHKTRMDFPKIGNEVFVLVEVSVFDKVVPIVRYSNSIKI